MGPLWLGRDPSDLTNMKIFDFLGGRGGGACTKSAPFGIITRNFFAEKTD